MLRSGYPIYENGSGFLKIYIPNICIGFLSDYGILNVFFYYYTIIILLLLFYY